MKPSISQSRLKELLHYDPDTGIFTWRVIRGQRKAGTVGTIHSIYGYRLIKVHGKLYRSARLAMLYMNGNWPPECVDHVNHNRSDDRFDNLREASYLTNNHNASKTTTNTSGYNGVYFMKSRNKWRAYITVNYKQIHLGLFSNLEDAADARKQADKKYEFHNNHGR